MNYKCAYILRHCKQTDGLIPQKVTICGGMYKYYRELERDNEVTPGGGRYKFYREIERDNELVYIFEVS